MKGKDNVMFMLISSESWSEMSHLEPFSKFHWKPATNLNPDNKVKTCSLMIKHVIVKHLSNVFSQVQILFYLSNEVDEKKIFCPLYSVPFSNSLQSLFINCWECNEP